MPLYILAYHGGEEPESEAEMEKIINEWRLWLESLGSAVVDEGHPVGMSTTVYKDRIEENGGANPLDGYTFLRAETEEDVIAMSQRCPILNEEGASIEIAQVMEHI